MSRFSRGKVNNPADYGPHEHDGSPLLVVRYEWDFLRAAFERAALPVQEMRHHGGSSLHQSEIFLTKAAQIR